MTAADIKNVGFAENNFLKTIRIKAKYATIVTCPESIEERRILTVIYD